MTKILFTHSYFYKLDAKQWRFKQPYPPLGTILAAAVMRDAKISENSRRFSVSFFDTALRDSPEEIIPVLRKESPK